MKTYQFLMCMMLCGGVTSETNGFNFQQPSSKWAFAQSYSWVVTNNGNNFDPQTQQSQEQAQIQQQMQQRTEQQQMQQLALQQQARQAAQTQQALQQQTLQAQIQQQMQQQALQAQVQQEAVENARQQREKQRFSSQPNSIRFYKTPNEPNGQVLRNSQPENKTPLSVRRNENTQEFIDEIVRKVIQQTRSESALPTTREDIEKIVRKILLEDTSNKRDLNSDNNRMNRYLNNVQVSNDDQTNTNLNGLVETFNPSRYPTYPSTPTEQFNPRTECIVNCRDSESNGQPIAIAMANAFFPPNRSNDPNMVANSFTYTSV